MGDRLHDGLLLDMDEAGRMSAGQSEQAAAQAGGGGRRLSGTWRLVLRSELMKVMTLPSLGWTILLTCAAQAAVMLSAFQNETLGGSFGFGQIVKTWTLVAQIGFLAAGILVSSSEHSSGQGMTTLLVTPGRVRVAAARLVVLTCTGLLVATAMTTAGVVACPAVSAAAWGAGGRTVAWLTAVLLMAAGAGEMVRRTTGAVTAMAVLIVLGPELADLLGEAARWLPGSAGQDWVTAGQPGAGSGAGETSGAAAGLTALAWTTLAQAGGFLRLTRSDA